MQGTSIIQDPLFTNADIGNLNLLTSSAAIDSGQVQSDLSYWSGSFWQSEFINGIILAHGDEDIDGQIRISTQIDISADEF